MRNPGGNEGETRLTNSRQVAAPHSPIEYLPDRGIVYECGHWRIDLSRRELKANGIAVPIGLRAFEVLEILVQSAGAFVSKQELMHRVWPGATVGDNNLQVHVSAIRKALGHDRGMLKTVSGRGYCLISNWTIRADPKAGAADDPVSVPPAKAQFRSNMPRAPSELIGRDRALRHVRELLLAHRAVTLTGDGGIGKTRLALEVARSQLADCDGDSWLVELASLSDPALVPSAVATAIGLRMNEAEISAAAIAGALGDSKLLLVLDNCEHVIGSVAQLAEAILHMCPCASILLTSREPVRIEGEHAYRVPPLDVPAVDETDPDAILAHSAVRLFVAIVQATGLSFLPEPAEIPALGTICRRLDGIPLAIELAAARAATLGVGELASRLDDRFALLTTGRRTALPRQQTLRATLDWGYDLLSRPEQRVLNALAVFAGGFTLEAAVEVVRQPGASISAATRTIANLVEKSLVARYETNGASRWRLLETVRQYAFERLCESDDAAIVARRHATYFRDAVARSNPATTPGAAFAADESREIDNVRSALDWAFSETGDAMIGITLAASFAPIWLQESLMVECQNQIGRALDALAKVGSIDHDSASYLEMTLLFARGEALIHTSGSGSETISCWTKALEVAEGRGDIERSMRGLWRLWSIVINVVIFGEVFELLEKFRNLAKRRSEPSDAWIADRMIGVSLHFFGDQIGARQHLESLLDVRHSRIHQSDIVRLPFDKRISAHARLAVVLWLLGYPDRAMQAVEESVAEAVSLGHVLTLVTVLAQSACWVALACGDLETAERFITMLRTVSVQRNLRIYHDLVPCFTGVLLVKRGEVGRGLQLLRDGVNAPGFDQYALWLTGFLCDLGDAYGIAGATAMGLATIDRGLERSERLHENWCLAELLHVKGRITLQDGRPDAAARAEALLRQSLDVASHQATLSWRVRAATTLAKLLRNRGLRREARDLLTSVYGQFTEGFSTSDLWTVRELIKELS